MQATEAIKLILGIGDSMIGRLVLYDALNMEVTEVKLRKNPNCPVCGDHPTVTELIDYEQFCGAPAHDRSPYAAQEVDLNQVRQMTPVQLKERLDAGDDLLILDVRQPHEWEISNMASVGAKLIPQSEVMDHLDEFDQNQEIVVQCRSGVRSANVIMIMQQLGFKNLWNLDGGINRWAQEVDPSLPVY
jgi:adenylyltransferase/sulfurtransferase